jgi:hypothetical protein
MKLGTAVVATWIAGAGLVGCAADQTITMTPSNAVSAATANIAVRKSGDGNTRVDVKVRHLAPPERISKDAQTYIVWLRSLEGDKPPQNVGAMKVDDDLRGSLETTTPLRSFDIFITPETSATASVPSGPSVLEAQIRQP